MFKDVVTFSFYASFVSACLSSSSAQAQTTQAQFFQQIDTLHEAHANAYERIESLSAMFEGAPYVDGNLGEGVNGQYDRDPLYRFDVFDCTTYVETVLAGALSASSADFADNMRKTRYQDGIVSFTTRNHFASADWIPNNQWLFQDITQNVGQGYALQATTVIDKPSWYAMMNEDRLQGLPPETNTSTLLESLHQEGQAFVAQTVSTPYIPLSAVFIPQQAEVSELVERRQQAWDIRHDDAISDKEKAKAWHQQALQARIDDAHINQALLDRIPNGSVISMVRPDYEVKRWIGTNLNITHQSITIRKHGQLYLRHASQLHHKVIDEEFVAYFQKYLINSSLKGFNVQQPRFK